MLSVKVTKYFECLDSMKSEIREMDDNAKKEWKGQFKEHKSNYMEVVEIIKELKSRLEREDLLSSGANGLQEEDSNEEMIREGRELMDSNQTALQQTLQTVNEAKVLGHSSVEMLHQQHDQMDRIDGSLSEIETSLEVSRRIVRNLARRMLTDKYLWVMIFFVVCGIIGVVCVNFLL